MSLLFNVFLIRTLLLKKFKIEVSPPEIIIQFWIFKVHLNQLFICDAAYIALGFADVIKLRMHFGESVKV